MAIADASPYGCQNTSLSLWGAPIRPDAVELQKVIRQHAGCATTVLHRIFGTSNATCPNCGRTYFTTEPKV